MPRNYQKKSVPKYSDEALESAVQAVKSGQTIYAAAQEFQIPYQTLRRWIVDKPRRKGSGRESWLTHTEESCIVEGLKFISQCGRPIDRSDLSDLIQIYFKSPNARDSPFGDKPPGTDYLRSFEKRWEHELSSHKPELLSKFRAPKVSTQSVDAFFETYAQVIVRNNLQDGPNRIFNLDEVRLGADGRKNSVFVQKSVRSAYLKSAYNENGVYSAIFCASASGDYVPPFTVYKGAHLYEQWTTGGPNGALYACTESGWMQDSVFDAWMEHFVQFTSDLEKPVLLIYDGHGSHMTYAGVKMAIDNSIIILCLPPHTSHALQPLDVGVFPPLKRAWKEILKKWYGESGLETLSESDFPDLLKQLVDCLRPQNAMKGFKGSGLFPINKEEVMKRIVKANPDAQSCSGGEPTASFTDDAKPGPSHTDLEQSTYDTTLVSPLKDAVLTGLSAPISREEPIEAENGDVSIQETAIKRPLEEQEEQNTTKQLNTRKERPDKKRKLSSEQPSEPATVSCHQKMTEERQTELNQPESTTTDDCCHKE